MESQELGFLFLGLFSIDDDRHDRYFSSTAPQLPIRNNMRLDTNNNADSSRGNSNNKAKRRLTRQKNCNRESVKLELGSSSSTSVPVDQNRKNHDHQEPSWPHFEGEDYIVFCYKEDGAFDVVKDGCHKSEAASNRIDCRARSSSRPVNRKIHYAEETRTVERCRNERNLSRKAKDTYPTNDGHYSTMSDIH